MAHITSKQQKNSGQTEAEIEAKIQEARQALEDRICKTMAEAACCFNVPYHWFRGRHQHQTKPRTQAHAEQQLLLPAQEKVLCKWVKYWGNEGQPMSKNMLLVTVVDMSEHLQEKSKETRKQCLPDRKWVYAFMARHPDLKLKQPTGLDPTCPQCFNPAVVKGHFELLSGFLQDNNIPWENVYNMDEKGLQLGGGRRLDGSQYLYSSEQHICVKVQKGSLELITAIKCIATDGSILKPCLMFPRMTVLHEGYFEEDGVL